MLINADLHIHSKYSTAVSRDMELPEIAREAIRKGVKIVGTGDCLHPKWLDAIRELPESDGLFVLGDTRFVLTVEVEDTHRVHHLILLPEIAKVRELQEAFSPHCKDLSADGRPRLHLNGAEIADLVLEADGLVGPSHAFTPWTGVFAYYRSLQECYQEKADQIRFIELGLSADTDYADRIADLSRRTFLSNSDAHSPRSNKLAREFNQMELNDWSYSDLCLAIRREGGRRPAMNVGFYPEEGKYNRTACTRCFKQFSAAQKDDLLGRCLACGGRIKLGVRDRVELLADYPEPVHPAHRPPYLHLIPLAEIIAIAMGYRSATTASVQRVWSDMTAKNTEIELLIDADLGEVKAEPKIIEAIEAFRAGRVVVVPGGGGKYGEVRLQEMAAEEKKEVLTPYEKNKCAREKGQRSLFEF
jgi:uncharacterized protein (TIGR00375 family)